MENSNSEIMASAMIARLTGLHATYQEPSLVPNCSVCNDTGWRTVSEGKNPGVTRCKCRQREMEQVIQGTGVSLRHCSARLTDFPEDVQAAVRFFIERPADGVFIGGPTGTGKTHLAAAIVRAQLESDKRVSFIRAEDLYGEIRATYKNDGPTEGDILCRYGDVPLLVLDDLGGGSLSDYERRITLNLLDRRWNQICPTVVTSNWNLEEIGERMDARISSRLRGCAAIILGGHDRRTRR